MRKIAQQVICLYVLLQCSMVSFSQNDVIDSLKNVLQTQKEDTSKVNTLFQLSEVCEEGDILKYAVPALQLAEKLNYKKGIADASYNIGYTYGVQGDYIKTMAYYKRSLLLRQEMNDLEGTALSLNGIGFVYYSQGAILKALENFEQSLDIKEKIGNKKSIANALNNIAEIHNSQGDSQKAIEYFEKCLKLSKEADYKFGVASSLFGLGFIYNKQGSKEKAVEYIEQSLLIQKEINDREGEANSMNSLALIYSAKSMDTKALEYLNNSLQIAKEINDRHGISTYLNNIGGIFLKQKNYKQAEIYCSQALQIANSIGEPETISRASANLSEIYSALGNYKEAYKMQLVFKKMADSISNMETKKSTMKKQVQYEFDKKELDNKLKQEKKDALMMAEIEKHKIIRNYSIALLLLVIFFGTYVFIRFKERKKLQNQQALMNERLRISRELHDDVGSTLSGIAMYSHLTKEQIKNVQTSEVEKSLNIIQQSAGEMVNKLNDIIWLSNPDQDTLEKLIQRLEEYATEMATIKNMQVKVNVSDRLHEHSLPVECRRNIYLFCKEAINNAVKYSNGTLLELNVAEVNNKLEFAVTNNGKGFDAVTVKRGNGLENMQKRADEIGAILNIQSKHNEGSTVCMQLKI